MTFLEYAFDNRSLYTMKIIKAQIFCCCWKLHPKIVCTSWNVKTWNAPIDQSYMTCIVMSIYVLHYNVIKMENANLNSQPSKVIRCPTCYSMVQMKFSAHNENDSRKHIIPYLHTKQSNSFHAPLSYIYFFLIKNSFIYANICPKHSTQSLVFFNTVTSRHTPIKIIGNPLFVAELWRSEPAFYTS